MKKYDAYKPSGIEWIGEIPSHWEVKKFGSISYMKGRIGWQGLKQAEFTSNPEDPFLITGMNFHDGKIRWDEVYHILEERYNEAPEIQLKESDVLFTKDGTIGKLLFVDSIPYPHKASLNSHLLVLRPLNDSYKPRFLYYQLKSLPFKHHVELTKTGTTFYGITQEAMGQYKALVPTPQEQTAIATYLDRKTTEIDELIADKKRLLELYEEEKTAIINQAVTKGINPDVPMKDSGIEWIGEIPKHWKTSPLKYLGKFINGFSFKSTDFASTGVRVLKISNIQHMRIDWTDESFIDEIFYETHENFRVLENDLVFALTRPIISTGIKVALIDTSEPILINQRNSIYRPTNINVKWVYYILLSSNFIQEFDSRIDKTGQQPNISSNDIGEIKITIPNEDEQNEIISFIDKRCAEIEIKRAKTEKLIEYLTEYRTALISEVVTGKVKVI